MSSRFRLRPAHMVLILLMSLAAACASLPPVFVGPQAPTTLPAAELPATAQGLETPGRESPAAKLPVTEPVTETSPLPSAAPMTGTTAILAGEALTNTVPAPAITMISGQVVYRQRIALEPGAVVQVELQNITRADAPPIIVGAQRIETQGKQVPIPFSVEYDLSRVDPEGVYSLRASIIEGGLVTWSTTDALLVITRGAPTDQVELLVRPSANPQPAVAPGS